MQLQLLLLLREELRLNRGDRHRRRVAAAASRGAAGSDGGGDDTETRAGGDAAGGEPAAVAVSDDGRLNLRRAINDESKLVWSLSAPTTSQSGRTAGATGSG